MTNKKRVLIIGPLSSFREALKDLVDQTSGYRFVAEAESGREGMALARELGPDLVIMDYSLPDMSGMEVMRELKRLNPPAKVLVLGAAKYNHVANALRAGAKGFAVKETISGSLTEAMDTLDKGNYFLDDTAYEEVLFSILTGSA
jgi:DNA-binding NarL/FixJ family response regulator